jgi:hypothetical protein
MLWRGSGECTGPLLQSLDLIRENTRIIVVADAEHLCSEGVNVDAS